MAPGSSTPRATHIEEEGVLIDNFRLVTKGRLDEEGIRRLLAEHPWPARNPDQNLADLRAQVAANEKGVAELRKMVGHFGLRGGAGLHAARAGQCRRVGAAGAGCA